jgi:hypothetical protein
MAQENQFLDKWSAWSFIPADSVASILEPVQRRPIISTRLHGGHISGGGSASRPNNTMYFDKVALKSTRPLSARF